MTDDRRGLALGLHLGVLALLGGLQLVLPPFHHGMVARVMVLAAYAVGYNVLLGYTGLMSLGHAMFFAAGMYGTGLTIQHWGFGAGAGFLAGIVAGVAVGGGGGGAAGRAGALAGRVLLALKENEERPRLLGYNTVRCRLFAVVASGLLSAVAGSTYTLLFSYVGSTFGGILYSIYPLLWTLLGGAGTTLGPLVGTLVMTYFVDVASAITTGYLIVVGAALIVMVLWAPAGIVGGIRARWARWLP